jgi:glycosyltransferase involved in cell wall biosynthesis
LQRLAVELGFAGRCDWLSWVSDTERLKQLNQCCGLLLMSLWEGLGLRALAAIAAALTDLGRDAVLARRLAEAGPLRAAGFRWDATAAQVTAVLEACL